jgi:choline dehydrogenase-like flavoprotein
MRGDGGRLGDIDSRHWDVVIVGSGAGGATIAAELAHTGKSILILERGEHLPQEADNWDPQAVFIERKYRTKDFWYDKKGNPFHPNTHYWVGGNTTFYGATLMRLRPSDFDTVAHADGYSPAWPVDYTDMRPYYEKAEKEWRVRGQRGIDPTEPRDEAPYHYPMVPHEPPVEALKQHLEGLGWQPFPLPLGVWRDEPRGATPGTKSGPLPEGQCVRCQTCGGFPCKVLAKADARTVCLAPLAKAKNVTLLTGHTAVRVVTDASGKHATGVLCQTADGYRQFNGDLIVLAAGAVPTAALMLGSFSGKHPDGLANSSGLVGRNYMFHTLSAMVSVTLSEVKTDFPKTLGINDFYWGEPDGSYDLPMGHIQMLEHMSGTTLEGQVAEYLPPGSLPDVVMQMMAGRMLSFLCISEDLPNRENRVTIDDEGRITLAYEYNNLEGHQRLVKRLDAALDTFADQKHPIMSQHFQMSSMLPIYGTAHQCGTVRFGDDPRTSVLDPWCRTHDVDNLYVTDSSFFPSSAAVNPTLTIVANGMRVAEHLAERLSGRQSARRALV